MEALEQSMGGRAGVVDALLLADLSPKQQHFLALLMDPRRERDSMATICADAAVSPRELLDLFRSASFAKAHAIALNYVAEKSLDVAKDVVGKSIDQHIECPECRGVKVEGSTCPKCKGKGTIFRESDVDRQKMALEVAGLLKKGGGVNIAVQQNNSSVSSSPSIFSKVVKQSDEIAYDVKREDIIDGEVSNGP